MPKPEPLDEDRDLLAQAASNVHDFCCRTKSPCLLIGRIADRLEQRSAELRHLHECARATVSGEERQRAGQLAPFWESDCANTFRWSGDHDDATVIAHALRAYASAPAASGDR